MIRLNQNLGKSDQPGVTEDDFVDPKECLERWAEDREFKALLVSLRLLHALQQQGFRDVRLRREPYEATPNMWRFGLALGSVRAVAKDVERAVRAACAAIGLAIEKDFICATVQGHRAVGGFVLPEREQNTERA